MGDGGTVQKYCLVVTTTEGLKFEIYDFKQHLKKRMNQLKRESIKFVMKGRFLPVSVEEKIKV